MSILQTKEEVLKRLSTLINDPKILSTMLVTRRQYLSMSLDHEAKIAPNSVVLTPELQPGVTYGELINKSTPRLRYFNTNIFIETTDEHYQECYDKLVSYWASKYWRDTSGENIVSLRLITEVEFEAIPSIDET